MNPIPNYKTLEQQIIALWKSRGLAVTEIIYKGGENTWIIRAEEVKRYQKIVTST